MVVPAVDCPLSSAADRRLAERSGAFPFGKPPPAPTPAAGRAPPPFPGLPSGAGLLPVDVACPPLLPCCPLLVGAGLGVFVGVEPRMARAWAKTASIFAILGTASASSGAAISIVGCWADGLLASSAKCAACSSASFAWWMSRRRCRFLASMSEVVTSRRATWAERSLKRVASSAFMLSRYDSSSKASGSGAWPSWPRGFLLILVVTLAGQRLACSYQGHLGTRAAYSDDSRRCKATRYPIACSAPSRASRPSFLL
mmetsp:Transcript_37586/g.106152  ORF Transcript_37586/g.106152 Transcript_37586/m.106152 type:complete len:256 (+) Transcript_37586:1317-2084(+)